MLLLLKIWKIFFKKRYGGAETKFNFILSHYTMRHLVGPLGTFVQAYKMLAVGAYFLSDNFSYRLNLVEGETFINKYEIFKDSVTLFSYLKASKLVSLEYNEKLCSFLLRKNTFLHCSYYLKFYNEMRHFKMCFFQYAKFVLQSLLYNYLEVMLYGMQQRIV